MSLRTERRAARAVAGVKCGRVLPVAVSQPIQARGEVAGLRFALAFGALLLMAQAPVPEPAGMELIYHGEAASLLGRTVRDPAGVALGRVVDVLVDDAGQPIAAVLDLGGFLGMGSRRIAVAWRGLRFSVKEGAGRIGLEMTMDQIRDTPDYKRPTRAVDPPIGMAAPPPPPVPADGAQR